MKWLRRLLGALVVAVALVLFAPAALLDAPLATRTGERLRVADARGVWWRGQGVVTATHGAARVPLAWRVDPGALARGGLVFRLRDPDTAAALGTISVARGSIAIHDLHVRVAAAFVSALDARLEAVALGGSLVLDAPAYELRAGSRAGELDATWERARIVAGDAVVDLGTVTLDSAPIDGGSAGTIRNTDGDVTIAGAISDRGGTFDAALTLTPAPDALQSVRTFLPLLGAPDGAGGVRISWRGRE